MMSDFMFPIYLATNKIQKQRRIRRRTEGTTKDREVWYQERPTVGQDKPKREAKLKHGNLQISKGVYIIIRYC